jgi:hypothetical protein
MATVGVTVLIGPPTTAGGFYAAIHDFCSCISPKHRATRDGNPVVPLYAAAFAKKWDASFLGRLPALFPKEFQGAIRGSLRRFPGT